MKFLEKIVVTALILCVVYAIVAVVFQGITGCELSPTLTDKWYSVFGIELLATMVITITKTITSKIKTENKIKLMKENGIMPEHSDFKDESGGYSSYYGEYSDDFSDEAMG